MRAVRGHHVKSSPYHPQRNGQAETTNKTPLKILSRMVYKEPKQWTCLYCGDVFEEWMVPAFERGPNGRARPLGHEPIRMPGWWLKRAFDGRRNPEERLECRIFWLILGRRAYYLNFFFFNMLGRLLSWLVHQSTLFITSFRNSLEHCRALLCRPTHILPSPFTVLLAQHLGHNVLRWLLLRDVGLCLFQHHRRGFLFLDPLVKSPLHQVAPENPRLPGP